MATKQPALTCVECSEPAWLTAEIRPDGEALLFCRAHAYTYMKIEAALREGAPWDEGSSIALRRLCAQAVFAGRYHLPLRLMPPTRIEFILHGMSVAVRPLDLQWGLMIEHRAEQASVIVATRETRGRADLIGWAWRAEVERCATIRKGTNGPPYHILPAERLRDIDLLERTCRRSLQAS